jgi:hypothetical protein
MVFVPRVGDYERWFDNISVKNVCGGHFCHGSTVAEKIIY